MKRAARVEIDACPRKRETQTANGKKKMRPVNK